MTTVSNKTETSPEQRISLYDRGHLKMISLIHDHLFGAFIDPYKLLRAAGLSSGQRVLEVGPGPGFFTIPAAEIIGKDGRLYSLDINPAAVKKVREIVAEKGLKNTEVSLGDVVKTNLPDSSIDVAFLFGVIHNLRSLDDVLAELYRILNNHGIIAVQKSSWSEKKLLTSITKGGAFRFAGKDSRVYKFEKMLACQLNTSDER